jgi:hypothetical protein
MKPKRSRKLFCTVIARIIDTQTGEEAGLLYRWNTGATQKEWHHAPIKQFRLEHLPDMSNFPSISDD